MDELEPTLFLNTRLLHDLAGPLGAIETGLSLIQEDRSDGVLPDDDTLGLLADSAQAATLRLRMFRLVFGRGGAAPPDAADLTGLFSEYFRLRGKSATFSDTAVGLLGQVSANRRRCALCALLVAADIWPLAEGYRLDSDGPFAWDVSAGTASAEIDPRWTALLAGETAGLDATGAPAWFLGTACRATGGRSYLAPADQSPALCLRFQA